MPNWFWARGGERRGPVSFDQIRSMVSSGEILSTDLAWTPGMTQWKAVGQIADLATQAPVAKIPAMSPVIDRVVAQVPVAALPVASQQLTYFGTQMPPRAEENLRGHARPKGDVGTWPMDDTLFGQMQETLKIRKRIYSAAQLFRGLFALMVLASIVIIFSVVAALAATGGRRSTSATAIAMVVISVFCVGFCVLYWLLYRFTMRSHRWAPLTFFILTLVGFCVNGIQFLVNMKGGSLRPDAVFGYVVGAFVGLIITIAFAFVSWRAFRAIPRYLAQPAWCQEFIAAAKM